MMMMKVAARWLEARGARSEEGERGEAMDALLVCCTSSFEATFIISLSKLT
jgi:hypothetical protein